MSRIELDKLFKLGGMAAAHLGHIMRRVDVVKIVCTPSEWYNFDSYAINSEWLAVEDIAGDGSVDGCNVPLAVIYRTAENDPYTVRT